MNLQDFACAISDLVWGSERGWKRPNESEGLQRLFSVVKKRWRTTPTSELERVKGWCEEKGCKECPFDSDDAERWCDLMTSPDRWPIDKIRKAIGGE